MLPLAPQKTVCKVQSLFQICEGSPGTVCWHVVPLFLVRAAFERRSVAAFGIQFQMAGCGNAWAIRVFHLLTRSFGGWLQALSPRRCCLGRPPRVSGWRFRRVLVGHHQFFGAARHKQLKCVCKHLFPFFYLWPRMTGSPFEPRERADKKHMSAHVPKK